MDWLMDYWTCLLINGRTGELLKTLESGMWLPCPRPAENQGVSAVAVEGRKKNFCRLNRKVTLGLGFRGAKLGTMLRKEGKSWIGNLAQ